MRALLCNLGCRFFPFITLSILCHSLLACRVSAEKSNDRLEGVPLCIISCFSLTAFKIIFNFCHFNYNASRYGMLWVYTVWDSLCFLDLGVCFLSQVREVFSYYVFKFILCPFFSSPSGTPIMWVLVCVMLSQRSLKLFKYYFFLFEFLKILFSYFYSVWVISTTFASSLLICASIVYNREGNGNPLQCSCLENPRDGWAWWAAVYGVAQLKRLSSSSSSSSI